MFGPIPVLEPGTKGPYPVCFYAIGDPRQPLQLTWTFYLIDAWGLPVPNVPCSGGQIGDYATTIQIAGPSQSPGS